MPFNWHYHPKIHAAKRTRVPDVLFASTAYAAVHGMLLELLEFIRMQWNTIPN
jgi:hypothetical protein